MIVGENSLVGMFPADGLTLHSGGRSQPSPVRAPGEQSSLAICSSPSAGDSNAIEKERKGAF